MKSIPPEVYEQWGKFEDDSKDAYVVKRNPDLIPIEELQEIRQEIEKIPTTIKGIGYFNKRDIFAYQIDVLKIIDTHIKEITNEESN